MSLPIIFMTILSVACALIFSVVRITKGGVASLLTKTLASVCFVVLGVAVAFEYQSSPYATFLVIGLVFGLVGDVLLDLKSVETSNLSTYLNFGMFAFGIGHIFYTLFVVLQNGAHDLTLPLIVAGVFALCVFVAVFFGGKIIGLRLGKFAVQSGVYASILGFTAALTVALCFQNIQMLMLAIAMVSFCISDSILSLVYFGGKSNSKLLSVLLHVFYYGAQIAIALFLVTL